MCTAFLKFFWRLLKLVVLGTIALGFCFAGIVAAGACELASIVGNLLSVFFFIAALGAGFGFNNWGGFVECLVLIFLVSPYGLPLLIAYISGTLFGIGGFLWGAIWH